MCVGRVSVKVIGLMAMGVKGRNGGSNGKGWELGRNQMIVVMVHV